MTQQVFEVEGLHCQSCVGAVKDALGELAIVEAVDVVLGTDGPSRVTVQAQTPLSVEQVQTALADEGDYTVLR